MVVRATARDRARMLRWCLMQYEFSEFVWLGRAGRANYIIIVAIAGLIETAYLASRRAQVPGGLPVLGQCGSSSVAVP